MPLERNEPPANAVKVDGTRGDRFVAGGEVQDGAFLIWPEGLFAVDVADIANLRESDLAAAFDLHPARDILLIGSGSEMRWPDFDLLERLRARGLGADVMDSHAAARTFNLLASEGRQVAALILPLK